MPAEIVVFDAYGTLFDVAAAARKAAEAPGQEAWADLWPALAETWRLKQLQYTWLRAITGAHCDFWQVTQEGLDFALEAQGLHGDPALRARLLALYWELEAYGEVHGILATLKAEGRRTAILSNGSPDMLRGAVDHAGIGPVLDDVLSVERVGVFKPAPQVYDLVGLVFGIPPSDVLFVSANGWDAAGAKSYGFQTAWVNRAGDPVDRLPWRPDHIVSDLSAIPELAR